MPLHLSLVERRIIAALLQRKLSMAQTAFQDLTTDQARKATVVQADALFIADLMEDRLPSSGLLTLGISLRAHQPGFPRPLPPDFTSCAK